MAKKLYNYIYKSRDRNYKLIINADSDVEAIVLRDRLLAFYANDAARLEEMLQQNGIEHNWGPTETKRKARIKEAQIYRESQNNLHLIKEWVLIGNEREGTYNVYGMNENDQQLVVYVEGERGEKDKFKLQRQDFDDVSNYTEQVTQQIGKVIIESPALIASIEAYVAAFNREAGESRDPIQLESLRSRLFKEYFGENFSSSNSVIIYLDKVYQDKFYSVESQVNSALISRPQMDDNPLEVPDNTLKMTLLMFTVTRLSESLLDLDEKINRAIMRFRDLLKKGHDINAQDVYGRTTLMYVAMGYRYFHLANKLPGREQFTRLLLENGADVS
ncbi:MAG: hypothetical protein K2Q33_04075, partial [Gammaproteobacteria bacterium]|nr:hypothetical protein [Gammaproteobacteria bacterium]